MLMSAAVDRVIVMGCVEGNSVLDDLVILEQVDNPWAKSSQPRFSKSELLEVG